MYRDAETDANTTLLTHDPSNPSAGLVGLVFDPRHIFVALFGMRGANGRVAINKQRPIALMKVLLTRFA